MTGQGRADAAPDAQQEWSVDLDDRADAVRAGRHFVRDVLRGRTGEALLDDAGLVISELLANAREHGQPPVGLRVCLTGSIVRLEVSDASSRVPVRPAPSTTNMTGRGIAIVDSLAVRWGVERRGGGKAVWVDLGVSGGGQPEEEEEVDVDELLLQWEEELEAGEPRYSVVLGDVRTDLLIEAKAHIDNVVREFGLAAAGAASGQAGVPEHLARLIGSVVTGFAEARDAIKRQALAALARGEARTRLTLHLPLSAAAPAEEYLQGLDEADQYARAARLLTLETPPDHRLFRQWYVGAVVEQLRAAAAGVQPPPVTPFEDVLVRELRRLSAASRVSERAARLQRVSAALARARTPEDVAVVVLREGVDALGASGGGLLVPHEDGVHLAVPGVVGYGAELLDALRAERLDAPLPAATALRTGEPVWLESQSERDASFPELRGLEASTVAMCAVPLVVGGRALGALRFSFAERRLFDDDERAFVLALAAQTAQTLQRAERYEDERRSALALQRALLPARLPAVPGWTVATHYSPAGQQQAGGDFYDLLPLPDGRVSAVVGDVMGRGVEAAAAMAVVRSTLGAYALDDPDPVAVLQRVDRFFRLRDLDQLVTAVYLLLDPASGDVVVASAGHPAPLLVQDGQCRPVPVPAGTPFGVADLPRAATALRVERGSSLLVFTDGLVERRGEDVDAGIARAAAAAVVGAAELPHRLLRRLLQEAHRSGESDDDETVMVLRRD